MLHQRLSNLGAVPAPGMMRAVALGYPPKVGEVADSLVEVSVSTPTPRPGEVVIELVASAMHIDEIYAAQGTALGRFGHSGRTPIIMGSSAVGRVVEVGPGVNGWSNGDDVIVVPSAVGEVGSWATYRCVAAEKLVHLPGELTHVEAAAATLAACVALAALDRARASSWDRCLVVGASGAVGSMVLQFLKMHGCHVTAVSSAGSRAMVQWLGADDMIDYTKENFEDFTEFDLVIDCVGGTEIETQAYRALKPSGRFVTIVGPVQYVGERKLSWVEISRMIAHVVIRQVSSTFVGPRYRFSATLPRNVIHRALTNVVAGRARMPIERQIPFDLNEIKRSIKLLQSHRARGRIVIDFRPVTNVR